MPLNKRNQTNALLIWNYISSVYDGLVLWHINHCRLFNGKYISFIQTVLFQKIRFSIGTFEISKSYLTHKQCPVKRYCSAQEWSWMRWP